MMGEAANERRFCVLTPYNRADASKTNREIRGSQPSGTSESGRDAMSTPLMKTLLTMFLTTAATLHGASPLRLVQTITMPNVRGRLDHMDVDVKGGRLFVAGLENGSL